MIAYEREYLELPKHWHDSYHQMYNELAFFIDDGLFASYEESFNVAVKCCSDQRQTSGLRADEAFCKMIIANKSMVVEDEDKIGTRLLQDVPTCPAHDRLCLFQTLAYCRAMYKVMWDEWAAFANLIGYQKRTAGGWGNDS